MTLLADPFFWAFVSMFAIVGASQVVSGTKLGEYPIFGFIVVALFGMGRVILVLPSLPQPRFESGGWQWVVGGIAFILGLIFSIPALTIRPFTAPDENVKLRTTGLYRVVRNPIYLGEVLWCLGWSILFRSIIGVALVPFWWVSLFCLTLIEEKSLARELGQPYLAYQKQVRGGIIPGIAV